MKETVRCIVGDTFYCPMRMEPDKYGPNVQPGERPWCKFRGEECTEDECPLKRYNIEMVWNGD